jgi:diguanylate cyclase (GGDEF)-like protein
MDTLNDSLKLLLVDDDDVDRERVRRLLKNLQLNCHVTEACTICEAKDCLEKDTFDCILLDYHIGSSFGTDILQDSSYLRLKLPVILVTGQGNERIAVQAMQNGVCDYIPKAQLREDLLETVLLGTMRRAKLEQELRIKQERLEFLSFFDSLTGLANRALFFDRFQQALQLAKRNGRTLAVMQIDLNLFKLVNDTYGHAVGDGVLIAAAQRIKKCLRAADTAARLGGDEFAVLLTEIHSPKDASIVAEKISKALQDLILIDTHLIQIGASIGIALHPEQGDSPEILLKKADMAMYVAKRSKKNSAVYINDIDLLGRSSLAEIDELILAIDNKELFVEYQPIIDLSNQRLRSVEALVRWQSKNGNVIYPGEFIPTAESSDVIYPLTYAVINLALDQARNWFDLGFSVPVAVNLSVRMLDDDDFPMQLINALRVRNLPISCITFELTETAVMSNIEQAKKVFGQLNAMGVKIAIDDFGVGFTSLQYLQQLDISEIKIDKIFAANLQRDSRSKVIIESVVMLAKGLGTTVVVEGIENIGLVKDLRKFGCHFGQGYGIAYPMRSEKIRDWKLGRK